MASMFGVMWVVPSPPSSPTGTPSIVVFLFSELPPLMLRPRPEFHWAKSRLKVVSTTPGRIFIMPNTSRPLTWIIVSWSPVTVRCRLLAVVCTGVTSAVTVMFSDRTPTCSASLPRSRVSPPYSATSGMVIFLKPSISTLMV